jgi:hypothetical protein
MDDGRASSRAPAPNALTLEELQPRWESFRACAPITCPRDGGPVAIAVDATAHAYRMVCVSCGAASAWFESRPTGIHVRTGTSSMPAGPSGAP